MKRDVQHQHAATHYFVKKMMTQLNQWSSIVTTVEGSAARKALKLLSIKIFGFKDSILISRHNDDATKN